MSFAPGAKQFLKVSGLPAKAQRVTVKRLSGSLTAASGILTGGTYM